MASQRITGNPDRAAYDGKSPKGFGSKRKPKRSRAHAFESGERPAAVSMHSTLVPRTAGTHVIPFSIGSGSFITTCAPANQTLSNTANYGVLISFDSSVDACYFSSRVPVLQHKLSRRERQIMDVLYRRGRATVAEIMADMPDPPSNSAVRALLRTLEEKKHIRHQAEDLRYVYTPAMPVEKARRSAVIHLIETFFEGSTGQAVATMLDVSARRMKSEELDRLADLIDKARKEGR